MEKNTQTTGKAVQGTAQAAKKKQVQPAPSQTVVGDNGQFDENNVKSTLSVEEKIKKALYINDLIYKRGRFNAHLERINELEFNDFDEEKHIITISTGTYNEQYTIKSGYLCGKIAELLTTEINIKVAGLEAEIELFSI